MNRAYHFTLAATAAGLLAFAAPVLGMSTSSAPPLAPQDSQYAKDAAEQARMEQTEIPARSVPSWYAKTTSAHMGASHAEPPGL
ncbi:MAG TPA: hypothetical protein VLT85_12340 [Terriglobales bacterium]|nr:hypothetical protein [Terriglobales bacterium]